VTVLAMYYVGAAGLWCSVRAKESWRACCTRCALGSRRRRLWVVLTPAFTGPSWGCLFILLWIVDLGVEHRPGGGGVQPAPVSGVLHQLVPGAGDRVSGWWRRCFVNRTVRWIADRDRTRHWYDEPTYRRSRRPEFRCGSEYDKVTR